MYTVIRIKLNERAVVFHDGLPYRALGPGRHVIWTRRLTEQRWTTDNLVFQALPEVRAILPADWYREVTLASRERGVLYRDGKPCVFLRPGTHRYWTVDPSVRLEVISVDAPMPDLTPELAAILPDDEYVDATSAACSTYRVVWSARWRRAGTASGPTARRASRCTSSTCAACSSPSWVRS
jgi:hypothetical protein